MVPIESPSRVEGSPDANVEDGGAAMAGATEDELWRRGDGGCGCSRRLSCMLLYGDGRTYMHTDLGCMCDLDYFCLSPE